MWIPYFIDGFGLVALYPLFLLAWVPLEVLAFISLILSLVAAIRRRRFARRCIAITVADVIFLVVSLPTLWFGEFPWYLFVPEPW